MNKLLSFLFLISIFACQGRSHKNNRAVDFVSPNYHFASLLPGGKHRVSFYSHKDLTRQQKDAIYNLTNAFKQNPESQDYFQKLKYLNAADHKKLGINQMDLKAIQAIYKVEHLEFTDSISIYYTEDNISFKGGGRLSIFDSLIINCTDSSVRFGATELPFFNDTIDISDEFIPDNEQFEQRFYFQGPGGLLALLPGGSNRYELLIGELKKSGDAYFYFSGEIFDKDMNRKEIYYSLIIHR